MERGSYSRQRFAETFGKLILDILAHTGQIRSRDFASHVEMLENNTLDLPPEILMFLKIRLASLFDSESPGFFTWILELIGLKRPPEVPDGVIDEDAPLHQELNKAVAYLEHELEVYSNQNGN